MLLHEHGARCKGALRHAGAAAEPRRFTGLVPIMAHDDVDHAADRVGAVERRALRAANDLDPLDAKPTGGEKRVAP